MHGAIHNTHTSSGLQTLLVSMGTGMLRVIQQTCYGESQHCLWTIIVPDKEKG